MEDKTIITVSVGVSSMIMIVMSYISYLMIIRPSTDGVIFSSVVLSIGTIAAGIIGFHFGKDLAVADAITAIPTPPTPQIVVVPVQTTAPVVPIQTITPPPTTGS